jgi:tetratricopeptide (TPR) repeat protein
MTSPDANDDRSRAIQNLRLAEQLSHQRKWAEADAHFAAAVDNDPSAGSCVEYGCALVAQERFHDAIQQMTFALDRASITGDRDALAAIFHNFASIYRDLGDFDLARRFQHRAILQVDECGPDELLGLANDAWVSGRPEGAELLAASAADFDDVTRLEAQGTLAVIAGKNGDPRGGIRSLLQVYRSHRASGDYRSMGIDLLNLSVLFGELGRHRREMALVRRAIRCFDFAPAPVSAEKARRMLAMLERLQSAREFDASRN